MSAPAPGPLSLAQRAWDLAADLADRGEELTEIVSRVLAVSGPQVDAELVETIPPHGRAFWSSVSRAALWAVAIDVCLLVLGSTGAHPLPGLTLLICLGVLVWAAGFGAVAGKHKVRERRYRAGAANREALQRVAVDGARHVWAAQVPGDWQPLGPAPDAAPTRANALPSVTSAGRPAAWLRRFGAEPGELVDVLVDGSVGAVRRSIRSARTVPVVLFVAEPGGFADQARSLADECRIALFVVGPGLYAMSDLASRLLACYRDPSAVRSPAAIVTAEWVDAARARQSAL